MNEKELTNFGWRITTAEILYHMPDVPSLLQVFLWQDLDHLPRFPRLSQFLHFWETTLDGPLHSVRVAIRGIIGPTDFRKIDGEYRLQ